jgi:hypothetical protein
MQQYGWKRGAHVRADAEAVGQEVERLLLGSHGTITPAILLNAAQDPASAMHDLFDWDDRIAASKHREEQARYILRSITVMVEVPESEPIVTRAFVVVQGEDETGHRWAGVIAAMQNEDWRFQVVRDVRRMLQDALGRMHEYEQLVDLFGPRTQLKLEEVIGELQPVG